MWWGFSLDKALRSHCDFNNIHLSCDSVPKDKARKDSEEIERGGQVNLPLSQHSGSLTVPIKLTFHVRTHLECPSFSSSKASLKRKTGSGNINAYTCFDKNTGLSFVPSGFKQNSPLKSICYKHKTACKTNYKITNQTAVHKRKLFV